MIVVGGPNIRRERRASHTIQSRRLEAVEVVADMCDEAGGPIPTVVARGGVMARLGLTECQARDDLVALVADGRLTRGRYLGHPMVWPTVAGPAVAALEQQRWVAVLEAQLAALKGAA